MSFDGKDDDDGDGKPDLWGIPHWVAYEIRRKTKLQKLKIRPKWTTDKELFKQGIAPDDSTYAVSGTNKLKAVKISSRFVRGHLCPKSTAERISVKAARETFTLLNAVPMLQSTNNGIWKRLEQHCHDLDLADYSPSSMLRTKLTEENCYSEDIEVFLYCFFNRKLNLKNDYCNFFYEFILSYSLFHFELLVQQIEDDKNIALNEGSSYFILYKLAIAVIKKFENNNIWNDLLKENRSKDHWQSFVETNIAKKVPIWDFFPSQRKAISKGILNNNNAFTLQMPTSSGKTALCELIIYNHIKTTDSDKKILFLAPFRALASELKLQFSNNLKRYGIKAKSVYGGNTSSSFEKASLSNVDLLISTPEKFMALESVIPDFANKFDMVICDEGHLLDDPNRGLSYELLLSRLKQKNDVKFIFILAILPNVDDINKWFFTKICFLRRKLSPCSQAPIRHKAALKFAIYSDSA